MEEGCVEVRNGLEGLLHGKADAMGGGAIEGGGAAEGHRNRGESGESLGGGDRLEGDTSGTLEGGKGAILHGEDSIVTEEKGLLGLARHLVLTLERLVEDDGEALRTLVHRAAKALGLVEGEVEVIRTEETEEKGVDASVSLAAHAVARGDSRPRLLPRNRAALKGGDEAVSDNVGNRGGGGGGGGGHKRYCPFIIHKPFG